MDQLQLPGKDMWEEIREARRKGLTRQGNRYINISLFKRQPIEQNIPARMYEADFQYCFFWVLSGHFPTNLTINEQMGPLYEELYGPPMPLFHVIPYLNQLLGEKLETVYGFSALVDDYQYLKDLIDQGTVGLQPIHANLAHAHDWLKKQIQRLEAINLATGIADASRKLADQRSFDNVGYIEPAISPYEWQGNATELVELGYALLESKLINGVGQREQFIQTLASFFGKSVDPNPAKVIDKARGRKKETVTSKLKTALDTYLTTSNSDRSE
jgi:hypothetical protein